MCRLLSDEHVCPALQVPALRPLGSLNVLESEQLEKMSSYWASFLWEKEVRITSVILGDLKVTSAAFSWTVRRNRFLKSLTEVSREKSVLGLLLLPVGSSVFSRCLCPCNGILLAALKDVVASAFTRTGIYIFWMYVHLLQCRFYACFLHCTFLTLRGEWHFTLQENL